MFLRLILLLWSLLAAQAAADPDALPVKICTGKAFGVSYDRLINDFLSQVFQESGLDADVLYVPTKRAEFAFKNRNCEVFFAGNQSFGRMIERDDIFVVDVETIRVSLMLYGKPSETNAPFNLEQLNANNTTVAYFSSGAMDTFMTRFPKAGLVPVVTIEDGVKLLKKARVDYFIFPLIKSFELEGIKSLPPDLQSITLATVPLYIWADNTLQPYETALRQSVEKVKQQRRFDSIFVYSAND